jgi:hypothetical protein
MKGANVLRRPGESGIYVVVKDVRGSRDLYLPPGARLDKGEFVMLIKIDDPPYTTPPRVGTSHDSAPFRIIRPTHEGCEFLSAWRGILGHLCHLDSYDPESHEKCKIQSSDGKMRTHQLDFSREED